MRDDGCNTVQEEVGHVVRSVVTAPECTAACKADLSQQHASEQDFQADNYERYNYT